MIRFALPILTGRRGAIGLRRRRHPDATRESGATRGLPKGLARFMVARMSISEPLLQPGPVRTTAKSAETRAAIVRGALQALEANGIANTTTRKIAAEAGVRLATLHYHFDSKDTLLLAVLDALVAELTQILRDEIQPMLCLDDRVAGLVRAAWRYAERTVAKQIVQFELTLYALRMRGATWLAARQYDDYVRVYGAMLASGTGATLSPAQAHALARFVLASIDGMILQSLAGLSPGDAEEGIEALIVAAQARARAVSTDA
jgi:AcrR family transcriptional regulator